jgi:uncharacterized protein YjbI with pentapeptide repeats
LAGISGFLSVYTDVFVSFVSSSKLNEQIVGLVTLILLIAFVIFIIRQGMVVAALVALVLVALALVAAALAGAESESTTALALVALALVALALAASTASIAAASTASIAVVVSALTAASTASIAVVVSALTALTAGYIAWRAMKGDARDVWVRSFAIAFAAMKGTSFRGADLTDANFTGARLKSTDLRKATLTRVRWYGGKMLDRVRPGDTYLKSTQVRQWLIGKGIDKNFDGQKLQGINLQGADLSDASFIDANLNGANLQDADLSRAKLVQTQLDQTDFTGATLTGAFIEDWGITIHTKLDDVKCEYVYMRLPTKENPEPRRKPDNHSEVFDNGDFADFIKPIFDTLDLYHNQGVDPRAIAISWKQLAENNPDAKLQFASMEVKGEDNLLLRLKTAPDTDLSKLSAEYFDMYNQIKALTEADSKKLIAEKDNRIQALENMVNTALKRPGFYAENYNHQGDNEMNSDRKIEGDYIRGNKTDQSRNPNISGGTINASGAGAFSLGDLSGTVANTINQLSSSSNPEEPGIKDLLIQIQEAIDDPQLSQEDKKQTLEQLQILAEAGQNPQDETMQKKAKKAVGFLKAIAEGVEPATKLAQACTKVLPKILAFFA